MQQRLVEMGDWLKVNGEAIYGTRYAGRAFQWTEGERPHQEFGEYRVKYDLMDQVGQVPRAGRAVKQVFFTRTAGSLYAITAGWPGEKLVLRGVRAGADPKVTLLGYDRAISARASGDTLTILMPSVSPEALPCRYAYAFRIPGGAVLPEAPETPRH
jgi:alpha-L-fucosidase